MEAPNAADRPTTRQTATPVKTCLAWSFLVLATTLLRIAATTAGRLDPKWLTDGHLGPGMLATVGVVLSGAGLLWSAFGGGWSRRVALLALLGLHLLTLAVFPTRSLLAWLQTDDVLFFADDDRGRFALTIDDGLDPLTTPLILAALQDHGVRATFFVFGETLESCPALAQRCLDEGHELANHQMTDTPAVSLEEDDLEARLRRADGLLRRFAAPAWFRPGGGVPTERSKRVAAALGCGVALGSVFPFDSHVASVDFATAYLVGRTGAGDIVVLHDGGDRGRRTAETLDRALTALAERGLSAVTLTELVAP